MENENLNSSESASEVVSTQPIETTEQPVNAGTEEVTTSPVAEKPQQSPEQNAIYADMRRKIQAEDKEQAQKDIDQEYADMFGKSNGIFTKADYHKAIKEQNQRAEAEKQGIDPAFYKRFNDMEEENKATKATTAEYERKLKLIDEHDSLNKDETFSEYYKEHEKEIQDNANNWRVDLTTAMMMSIKDNFKAIKEGTTKKVQQETINNIIKNGKASPGSIASTQNPASDSIADMSSADFKVWTEKAMRGELKHKE